MCRLYVGSVDILWRLGEPKDVSGNQKKSLESQKMSMEISRSRQLESKESVEVIRSHLKSYEQ